MTSVKVQQCRELSKDFESTSEFSKIQRSPSIKALFLKYSSRSSEFLYSLDCLHAVKFVYLALYFNTYFNLCSLRTSTKFYLLVQNCKHIN